VKFEPMSDEFKGDCLDMVKWNFRTPDIALDFLGLFRRPAGKRFQNS
jgi:hypothetical protein